MNYMKIQTDIAKSMEKVNNCDWIMTDGLYNNRVWVIYKRIAMYGIPECDFILDRKAICNIQNEPALKAESLKNIFNKQNGLDGSRCDYTYMEYSADKKIKMSVYKDSMGKIWRGDEKLFKYNTNNNYCFMFDDRHPLYVYDGADIEAVILPIINA